MEFDRAESSHIKGKLRGTTSWKRVRMKKANQSSVVLDFFVFFRGSVLC